MIGSVNDPTWGARQMEIGMPLGRFYEPTAETNGRRHYLCPECGGLGLDNPTHLCFHHEGLRYWAPRYRVPTHQPKHAAWGTA
jgi:hypothetical protein